jgi:phosphoserine phosphatase RsbU/P
MNDLLNIAPCGVVLFNDAGIIVTTNETLNKWLGYEDAQLAGKKVEVILSLASRIFYNTHWFPLIKLHARADEIFLNLITKEKQDLPVLSNTIRFENKGEWENFSVFIPLRERQKYEEEIILAKRLAENALKENKELVALTQALEERTQELDRQNAVAQAIAEDIRQFSKIVSHDLQEPIRKIRLFSSILESSGNHFSERGLSALKRIQASAERLSKLTSGLQEYVSVDEEAAYTRVDLNESVSTALEKVQAARDFNDIEVTGERLPAVYGFRQQLELMFYHLFDNAIKFRNRARSLSVRLAHTLLDENIYRSIEGKYKFVEHVRIIFSDNGNGFDNQYKDYVFDLVKKISTGNKDLGIGLALVKKIVHNHSGTIDIQSEPGKGTNVILVFPLKINDQAHGDPA